MDQQTRTLRARQCTALLLTSCLLASLVALAGEATVDIIGRDGNFQIIERNGTVLDIPESSLAVQDGKRRSYVDIPATPEDSEKTVEEEAPGSEEPVPTGEETSTPTEEGAKESPPGLSAKSEKEEETPEEKAAREADTRSLRALMQEGGAYFYDANHNPLSYEDVDKLIQEGKVDEIRGTGLHLGTWNSQLGDVRKMEGKTRSKPTIISGGGTAMSEKGSVHQIVGQGKPFRETVRENKPFDVKAYSAGTPKNGKISPLAVPEERRPFKEVLKEQQQEPFDPKKGRDTTTEY